MKLLVDLNVLLDVLEHREPHYDASAKLLSLIVEGRVDGVLPGHAPATIHYLITRSSGAARANEAIDWLLDKLHMAPASRQVYLMARALGLSDFEDVVVATMAAEERCDFIATRNKRDFLTSPVPALTPRELLDTLRIQ